MASNPKKAGAVAKAEPIESKLKEARSQAKLVIHPTANAALTPTSYFNSTFQEAASSLTVWLGRISHLTPPASMI